MNQYLVSIQFGTIYEQNKYPLMRKWQEIFRALFVPRFQSRHFSNPNNIQKMKTDHGKKSPERLEFWSL